MENGAERRRSDRGGNEERQCWRSQKVVRYLRTLQSSVPVKHMCHVTEGGERQLWQIERCTLGWRSEAGAHVHRDRTSFRSEFNK